MRSSSSKVDSGGLGGVKRLRLNKEENWLGGLCAGLGDFFGIDPAFIRLGAVVTALFLPKFTIATYLIAWVLLSRR